MTTNSTARVPAVGVTFHNCNGVECGVEEGVDFMTLTFGDGTTHRVTGRDIDTLGSAFMWHGAKQKFIDAGAIARNTDTGRSATLADKKAAILEVIERTTGANPMWNKIREGGGSGTLLLEALVRLYAGAKTRETVREYLDGLSPEQRRQLERNARVAPVIEAIRTERRLAAGDDGSDDLLAGLGDIPDGGDGA